MFIHEYVSKVMRAFPKSFINRNFELIVNPKGNVYFRLEDCTTEIDVKCKLLEYCSRACCYAQPYHSQKHNTIYQYENREHLNEALGTNFTLEDMYMIYAKLGNGINRKLTIKFINSGYDMAVLQNHTKEKQHGQVDTAE